VDNEADEKISAGHTIPLFVLFPYQIPICGTWCL